MDSSFRARAGVVLLVLVASAIATLGHFFGYPRAAIAVVAALILASFALRQIRSLANAPPDPEITDVSDYGLRYVCTMCGLELKVEVAARDRAPTHCMEPMKLVQAGGKPPLTTV